MKGGNEMKRLILFITTIVLSLSIGSATINAATIQPEIANETVTNKAQKTETGRATNYYFTLKNDLGYR